MSSPVANSKRTAEASSASSEGPEDKKGKITPDKKSPYDIYFETRNAWFDEHKEMKGSILIRGIQTDHDEEEEDSDDESEEAKKTRQNKYTSEQMNSLRFIMANDSREKSFDEMKELVLGEQANSPFKMFDTSFSYELLNSWHLLKDRILPRKSPAQKLDILMAYIYTIKQYDCWMSDNEGNMGELVKGLAGAWKRLLKNTDEKLGWDLEYTKPAVMELLEQFKQQIEGMESYYKLGKFNYN